MTKRLVVISGPDQGRSFPLPETDTLMLGRSRATETRLTDPHVSRVHCQVQVEDDRVLVSDFDSVGGTFVNDRRVARQELRHGDVLRIGATELRYEGDPAEEDTVPPTPAPAAAARAPAPPPAPAPAPAAPAAAPAAGPVFAGKAGGARAVPAALQQLQALAGSTLGRYHLLRVLGVGQIGVVFQARDNQAARVVALKVLKPEIAKDERAMQRFVRGLMAGRSFNHPNLVTLYNAGQTPPYWWIALEYVEGESLAQMLQKRGVARPLDWQDILRVGVHVGRALAFAHGQGVVHRNVLPANILVGRDDRAARLGDLLLAKVVEGELGPEVTAEGELVGNVYYLAPERTARGADSDGRADLWSLGVTLYLALTGRLPFTGISLVEVVNKVRTATPEPIRKYQPEVPDALQRCVARLLAKRPEDRYQTADELVADLQRLAGLHAVAI
jgi:pSer/pThr/pTyr-binding forkhead associated (FHA) protein